MTNEEDELEKLLDEAKTYRRRLINLLDVSLEQDELVLLQNRLATKYSWALEELALFILSHEEDISFKGGDA